MELIRISIPKYQSASALWVEENRYMKGPENQVSDVTSVGCIWQMCVITFGHHQMKFVAVYKNLDLASVRQCTRFRVPLPRLLKTLLIIFLDFQFLI